MSPSAQIDFRRAARAFDQHEVGLGAQARERGRDKAGELRLQALIIARFGGSENLALHDDLRADLALRLEQDRVHVDARRRETGAGLQRLRPADLAAVLRHCGVVRHVLRLEGQHAQAAPRIGAAKARDEQALADVRARALKHQRAAG